jgi:hypothetical protein
MVPTAEKVEHKYMPPSWMQTGIIEKLPKEKQVYWANRVLGNNGQGVVAPKPTVFKESPATIAFNNAGEMVVHNRAARRNRPANDPQYTKATQSLKVARKKEKLLETARAKKAAKKEKKNAEK